MIETFKKSIGIVDKVQVRVRIGPLMKDRSSELISFPKICPVCLKSTKEELKIETTLAQIQKTIHKEKKERVEKLTFEAPMCAKCSKKISKPTKYLPTQASPLLILLVLFYLGTYAGEMSGAVMNWIPPYLEFYAFTLILPLMLAIMYIIEKRSGDPILVSDISIGKDNPRLLERLAKLQNNKDAFVQAKLDPESRSSVTFSFRNPQYASLFVKENKALII